MEEEKKEKYGIKLGSETDEGGADTFDFYPNSGRNFCMQLGESPDTSPRLNRDFSFKVKEQQQEDILLNIEESKSVDIAVENVSKQDNEKAKLKNAQKYHSQDDNIFISFKEPQFPPSPGFGSPMVLSEAN